MFVPVEAFWALGGALVVLVIWFIYVSTKRPQSARTRLEGPFDSGLQWLIDQGWTPPSIDTRLASLKAVDLTALGGTVGEQAKALAGQKIAQAQALVDEAKALIARAGNPSPPQ
jgi:hypothetical protein